MKFNFKKLKSIGFKFSSLFKINFSTNNINPKFKEKSNLLKSTLFVFPGIRAATSDSTYFVNLNYSIRGNLDLNVPLQVSSLRSYLRKDVGLFSNSYYSSMLSPKVSTFTEVAGVSRDKKRSIMVKLANYNYSNGLKMSTIKFFSESVRDFYKLVKADKNSDPFLSSLKLYKNLKLLNTKYKDSNIPLLNYITYVSNNSTPKFVIKKHINNLPGRRKKKKRPLSLRSYLAFIKPSGRKISSLR